jgi:dephospho-CoA kinase
MTKAIIFLVGMPGAGKSTIADEAISRGIPIVYFGGITMNEVKRRGLEINEVNEKAVREELRKNEGIDVMAKRIIPEIDSLLSNADLVIADGLYSWTEYKTVKQCYGKSAIIVAVAAPRQVRHDRLKHRNHRPLSEEQVSSREYAEIENLEKGGPIANADFTLLNNKSTDELIAQFDSLLSEISA